MKWLTEVMLIMQGKDQAPPAKLEAVKPHEKVIGDCTAEIMNLYNYIDQLAKRPKELIDAHMNSHHRDAQGNRVQVSEEERQTVCKPFHREIDLLQSKIDDLGQILWMEVKAEVPEMLNYNGGAAIRAGNKIVAWNEADAPRNPLENLAGIDVMSGSGMEGLAALLGARSSRG
jgi:hypothetical protein